MTRTTDGRPWRRTVRGRLAAAFAVLLTLLLLTGMTMAVFGERTTHAFGTAAARIATIRDATAELRRGLTNQERTGHDVVNHVPVDVDTFLDEQREVDGAFARARLLLATERERRELAVAQALWQASLEHARLWGPAARHDDGTTTEEYRHVTLAHETSASMASLDRLDAQVQAGVVAQIARARRLEHMVFGALAVLFVLALGSAMWFGRRMANDVLRPVAALRRGVTRVEGGAFDEPVVLTERERDSEIGELAESFNTMAAAVHAVRLQRTALLKRTLDSGEQERTRVANDLHDGPIQRLAALSYLIDAGVMREAKTPGAALDCLNDVRKRVAYEVESLRRLMADLRPPALDHGGLAAALRDYVAEFSDVHRVPVRLTGDLGRESFGTRVETVAYRLVQEALTNVRRHASASHAIVTLARSGETFTVTIADDGVGFDRTAVDRTGEHFGLATMAERVSSAGGTLQVRSVPGAGTVVEATLPTAMEQAPEVVVPAARSAAGTVLDDPRGAPTPRSSAGGGPNPRAAVIP